MLIGARFGMSGGAKKKTHEDYLQSGLLALVDCDEFQGSDETKVLDLSGNGDFTLGTTNTIEDGALVCGGNYPTYREITQDFVNNVLYGEDGFTVELVADIADVTGFIWGLVESSFGFSYFRTSDHLIWLGKSSSSANIYLYGGYPAIKSGKNSISMRFKKSTKAEVRINDSSLTAYTATADEDFRWSVYRKWLSIFGNGRSQGESYSTGSIGSKIYSFRFYDSWLTEEQIAANYAIDKARFGLE